MPGQLLSVPEEGPETTTYLEDTQGVGWMGFSEAGFYQSNLQGSV